MNRKKVIYRCSSYRKYPKCEFQVKPVVCNNTNEITISTSNTHDHDQRAPTTCATSPARNIVINAVAARLTQSQTRRAIGSQFVGRISRTRISSLLNYHRSLSSSNIYSMNILRAWYLECRISQVRIRFFFWKDSDEWILQLRSSSPQVHLDELYQINTFLLPNYLSIPPKPLKKLVKKG